MEPSRLSHLYHHAYPPNSTRQVGMTMTDSTHREARPSAMQSPGGHTFPGSAISPCVSPTQTGLPAGPSNFPDDPSHVGSEAGGVPLRGPPDRPPSHPSIEAGARPYRTHSPSFGSAPMLSGAESSLAHDVEQQHQREEQLARDDWHWNQHQQQQQSQGQDPRSPDPAAVYQEAPSPFSGRPGGEPAEDRTNMMMMLGTSADQSMSELLEPTSGDMHQLFSTTQPHQSHGNAAILGSSPPGLSPIVGFSPPHAPMQPPPSPWGPLSWYEHPAASSAAAVAAAGMAAPQLPSMLAVPSNTPSNMPQPPSLASPSHAPPPPLPALKTYGSSPLLACGPSPALHHQQQSQLGAPLLSAGSGYGASPGPGSQGSGIVRQPSGLVGPPPHRLMGALSTALGSGHLPSASAGSRMLRQMVSESSTPRDFRLSSVSSASAAAALPHSPLLAAAAPGGGGTLAGGMSSPATGSAVGAAAVAGSEFDGALRSMASVNTGRNQEQHGHDAEETAGAFASPFATGSRDPNSMQFTAAATTSGTATMWEVQHQDPGDHHADPSSQVPPPSPPHFLTGLGGGGGAVGGGYGPPRSPMLEQLQPDDSTMHEFPGNGSQEQHQPFLTSLHPQQHQHQQAASPLMMLGGALSATGPLHDGGSGRASIAAAAPPASRPSTSPGAPIPISSPSRSSLGGQMAEEGAGPSRAQNPSDGGRMAGTSSSNLREAPGSTNFGSLAWLGSPASSCFDMLISPPGNPWGAQMASLSQRFSSSQQPFSGEFSAVSNASQSQQQATAGASAAAGGAVGSSSSGGHYGGAGCHHDTALAAAHALAGCPQQRSPMSLLPEPAMSPLSLLLGQERISGGGGGGLAGGSAGVSEALLDARGAGGAGARGYDLVRVESFGEDMLVGSKSWGASGLEALMQRSQVQGLGLAGPNAGTGGCGQQQEHLLLAAAAAAFGGGGSLGPPCSAGLGGQGRRLSGGGRLPSLPTHHPQPFSPDLMDMEVEDFLSEAAMLAPGGGISRDASAAGGAPSAIPAVPAGPAARPSDDHPHGNDDAVAGTSPPLLGPGFGPAAGYGGFGAAGPGRPSSSSMPASTSGQSPPAQLLESPQLHLPGMLGSFLGLRQPPLTTSANPGLHHLQPPGSAAIAAVSALGPSFVRVSATGRGGTATCALPSAAAAATAAAAAALAAGPQSTALAFDERMLLHHEGDGGEVGVPHPERPDRLVAIMDLLTEQGLVSRCVRVHVHEASVEELTAVHHPNLVKDVEEASEAAAKMEGGYQPDDALPALYQGMYGLGLPPRRIRDCYLNRHTYMCARLAAGAAAQVAAAVVRGKFSNGMAIIRPPGHHAESGTAMGFCYFNNACVAARAAQQAGAKKVLIMDWDIHHGNGTQHIFEDDPTVMYISTHRYDQGHFFPGTGAASEVGQGPGEGFTVNVPWDGPWVNDGDFMAAFELVVLPIAREFNPDLVLISAGFDAVLGDPLGECCVTPTAFGHMTRHLASLGKPVVALLEGGYNLRMTALATEQCMRAMLGDVPAPLKQEDLQVSNQARIAIQATLKAHLPFWRAASQYLQIAVEQLPILPDESEHVGLKHHVRPYGEEYEEEEEEEAAHGSMRGPGSEDGLSSSSSSSEEDGAAAGVEDEYDDETPMVMDAAMARLSDPSGFAGAAGVRDAGGGRGSSTMEQGGSMDSGGPGLQQQHQHQQQHGEEDLGHMNSEALLSYEVPPTPPPLAETPEATEGRGPEQQAAARPSAAFAAFGEPAGGGMFGGVSGESFAVASAGGGAAGFDMLDAMYSASSPARVLASSCFGGVHEGSDQLQPLDPADPIGTLH